MSTYFKDRLRLISLATLLSFGVQDIAWAAPVLPAPTPAAVAAPAGPTSIGQFISAPQQLDIPLEAVTLQEVHVGTNGKLIIHIQDAHANLSGQQSLAKALDHLMTRYDLQVVLVEGAARDASLDPIRKLAPLKEWKIIARRFLYDGIISGEEYLNLTTEHPMKILGVEYQNLYDDSIKAYAALVDRRKDILHYLYKSKVSLDRLKHKFYPQALKDYEAKKGSDDLGGTDFKSGFSELLGLAKTAGYPLDGLPNASKLENLLEQESSLDFARANAEQQKLLAALSAAGAGEVATQFIEQSKRLKTSQVSQYLLMEKLLKAATDQRIAADELPELAAYRDYLSEFLGLNLEQLLSELDLLEDKVYENLLPDSDARKVRAIDRFLGLLGNAYKLQMSSRDFGMFTFNEKDFPTESWLAFMNQKLAELGFFESMVPYRDYLEKARSDFGKFYELVGQRDEAFVANANRLMKEQNADAAVLIAGGYHTAHLTELLREEGTSYIVLTPVVTDTTDHEKYEDLLLRHLKQQEKRLSSSKDSGAYKAQNVAQTKIPRGIRQEPGASRMARPEFADSAAARLASKRVEHLGEKIVETAARMASVANVQTAPEKEEPQTSLGMDVLVQALVPDFLLGIEGLETRLDERAGIRTIQVFRSVPATSFELDSVYFSVGIRSSEASPSSIHIDHLYADADLLKAEGLSVAQTAAEFWRQFLKWAEQSGYTSVTAEVVTKDIVNPFKVGSKPSRASVKDVERTNVHPYWLRLVFLYQVLGFQVIGPDGQATQLDMRDAIRNPIAQTPSIQLRRAIEPDAGARLASKKDGKTSTNKILTNRIIMETIGEASLTINWVNSAGVMYPDDTPVSTARIVRDMRMFLGDKWQFTRVMENIFGLDMNPDQISEARLEYVVTRGEKHVFHVTLIPKQSTAPDGSVRPIQVAVAYKKLHTSTKSSRDIGAFLTAASWTGLVPKLGMILPDDAYIETWIEGPPVIEIQDLSDEEVTAISESWLRLGLSIHAENYAEYPGDMNAGNIMRRSAEGPSQGHVIVDGFFRPSDRPTTPAQMIAQLFRYYVRGEKAFSTSSATGSVFPVLDGIRKGLASNERAFGFFVQAYADRRNELTDTDRELLAGYLRTTYDLGERSVADYAVQHIIRDIDREAVVSQKKSQWIQSVAGTRVVQERIQKIYPGLAEMKESGRRSSKPLTPVQNEISTLQSLPVPRLKTEPTEGSTGARMSQPALPLPDPSQNLLTGELRRSLDGLIDTGVIARTVEARDKDYLKHGGFFPTRLQYLDALTQARRTHQLDAKVVFNPFGGIRPVPVFQLFGAEDVVTQTAKPFGSLADLEQAADYVNSRGESYDQSVFQLAGFDSEPTFLHLRNDLAMENLGSLGILRLMSDLDARITGIYGLEIDPAGRLSYTQPEATDRNRVHRHVMVEFEVPTADGGRETKRWWSFGVEMRQPDAGFERLVNERLDFDALALFGVPTEVYTDPQSSRNSYEATVLPAVRAARRTGKQVKVVHDVSNVRDEGGHWDRGMRHYLWKSSHAPAKAALGKHAKIGYSGDRDSNDVYIGKADDLAPTYEAFDDNLKRHRRWSWLTSWIPGFGARMSAQQEMPVTELLRTLNLIETDRSQDRIRIARPEPGFPRTALEALRAWTADVDEFKLLRNSAGDIVAIFPIVPAGQTSLTEPYRYLDLSDYYFDVPQHLPSPDLQKIQSAWTAFLSRREKDKAVIRQYIDQHLKAFRPAALNTTPPYVYARVEFVEGQATPRLRVERVDLAGSDQAQKYYQPVSNAEQIVFPVFPTVFSPAGIGRHGLMHFTADDSYYSDLFKYLEGAWRPDARVRVGFQGTGFDAWLAWIAAKRKLGSAQAKQIRWQSDDLNPFAGANGRALFRIAGMEVDVRTGSDFGGAGEADIYLGNMPYSEGMESSKLGPDVDRSGQWDRVPREVFDNFMRHLRGNLAPNGIAFLWNRSGLQADISEHFADVTEIPDANPLYAHYVARGPRMASLTLDPDRVRQAMNVLNRIAKLHTLLGAAQGAPQTENSGVSEARMKQIAQQYGIGITDLQNAAFANGDLLPKSLLIAGVIYNTLLSYVDALEEGDWTARTFIRNDGLVEKVRHLPKLILTVPAKSRTGNEAFDKAFGEGFAEIDQLLLLDPSMGRRVAPEQSLSDEETEALLKNLPSSIAVEGSEERLEVRASSTAIRSVSGDQSNRVVRISILSGQTLLASLDLNLTNMMISQRYFQIPGIIPGTGADPLYLDPAASQIYHGLAASLFRMAVGLAAARGFESMTALPQTESLFGYHEAGLIAEDGTLPDYLRISAVTQRIPFGVRLRTAGEPRSGTAAGARMAELDEAILEGEGEFVPYALTSQGFPQKNVGQNDARAAEVLREMGRVHALLGLPVPVGVNEDEYTELLLQTMQVEKSGDTASNLGLERDLEEALAKLGSVFKKWIQSKTGGVFAPMGLVVDARNLQYDYAFHGRLLRAIAQWGDIQIHILQDKDALPQTPVPADLQGYVVNRDELAGRIAGDSGRTFAFLMETEAIQAVHADLGFAAADARIVQMSLQASDARHPYLPLVTAAVVGVLAGQVKAATVRTSGDLTRKDSRTAAVAAFREQVGQISALRSGSVPALSAILLTPEEASDLGIDPVAYYEGLNSIRLAVLQKVSEVLSAAARMAQVINVAA